MESCFWSLPHKRVGISFKAKLQEIEVMSSNTLFPRLWMQLPCSWEGQPEKVSHRRLLLQHCFLQVLQQTSQRFETYGHGACMPLLPFLHGLYLFDAIFVCYTFITINLRIFRILLVSCFSYCLRSFSAVFLFLYWNMVAGSRMLAICKSWPFYKLVLR